MVVPIELIRQNAVNADIADFLNSFVLPDGMSFEACLVQLLDSYENAQKKFNEGKNAGERITFVQLQAPTNPKFGLNASEYVLTKTYNVKATVGTILASVEPARQ
jgi:hypothetical protein